MRLLFKVSVLGVLISTFSLSGCQKSDPQNTEKTASSNENTAVKTLSIGFQKSSLNLLVARQQQLFEQAFPNAKIEWREFPAGPQMLEALAVGAVDFGYVGNTPPIFAQAAAKPLSYVAYEVVAPTGQAVLVQKASVSPYKKGQVHMNYSPKLCKKQGYLGKIFNPSGYRLPMHVQPLINRP